VLHLGKLTAAFAASLLIAVPVGAQSVEEFYTGKEVNLVIGYSPGGGYDTYARLLARHMGKHIPGNPTIVPQNMPGAGSLRATNWLFEAAPQDGTAFATIARAAPFDPLFGNENADFKANEFNYIGSANNEVSLCAALGSTDVKTFDDLKSMELIVGGTGDTADTVQFPKIINAVFGTQMKIINGYPGGNDVVLAMERGEVDGRCGWSWSSIVSQQKDKVDDGSLRLLVQLSTGKHPDLPDVPLIMDLATNDADRRLLNLIFARQELGRPFVAPPNVPEDRVAALRDAFMATMEDPEFLAEAQAANLEITPLNGERIQQLVQEAYETEGNVITRIGEILN
jgi:tripartite-type tricarboxylate transporter receptor subunit TctC